MQELALSTPFINAWHAGLSPAPLKQKPWPVLLARREIRAGPLFLHDVKIWDRRAAGSPRVVAGGQSAPAAAAPAAARAAWKPAAVSCPARRPSVGSVRGDLFARFLLSA